MKISHWYGRLGNNVQQCAVGTMAAALTQSTFESIEHEIIKKHSTSFGQNSQEVRSKFFNESVDSTFERDVFNFDIPLDLVACTYWR